MNDHLRPALIQALAEPISPSLSDQKLRKHPLAVWIELQIGLEDGPKLSRRRPIADPSTLKARENGPRWVYLDGDIEKLAEMLGRHNPGPGTGSAAIIKFGDKFELPDNHQHLMRRAFWDASDIRVQKLPGGAPLSRRIRVTLSWWFAG